jgi:hypothetical protein
MKKDPVEGGALGMPGEVDSCMARNRLEDLR